MRAGDIIKLEYLTEVPVDCLLLQTSQSSEQINHCYVSTSNIDGRQDLVKKSVVGSGLSTDIYSFVKNFSGQKLFCSEPDSNIYDWKGVLLLDKLKIQVNMGNYFRITCII